MLILFNLLAQVDIGQSFAPAQKFTNLASLINLISKVVGLAGVFFILVSVVYTAWLYMSSGGEAKNIEKAKGMLTATVIGVMVIAAAYWITQIIARLVGTSF